MDWPSGNVYGCGTVGSEMWFGPFKVAAKQGFALKMDGMGVVK